jgi:hypothetical protein
VIAMATTTAVRFFFVRHLWLTHAHCRSTRLEHTLRATVPHCPPLPPRLRLSHCLLALQAVSAPSYLVDR